MLDQLLESLSRGRVFDLSQPYYVGMPHHPAHPPYLFGLTKAHGDQMRDGGVSSAAESIALGGHVGTHIDALCHFSKEDKLRGGVEAAAVQSYVSGISRYGVDTIAPILRRGVLLDCARAQGAEALGEDFVIDAELIEKTAREQAVEIRAGDVVLIRVGWDRYWERGAGYINGGRQPGINAEAAQYLSSKGIFAAGSDNIALEAIPSRTMPVHVHFLVERGMHIIEAMDLTPLAEARVWEFVFVAAPLKLKNATGAPIRPLAVAP